MLIRAAHLTFSKDKFWCDFWRRETGFVSVYRVRNYASPQTAESQKSVQTLVQKTPPLSEFLVAYWPIPNRNLSLTSRVILLTVVSSLLTEARLYEFSRHLEYYLWYTLANSPISFWNRLNPTFTMAGHFFWHPTSAIGTTKRKKNPSLGISEVDSCLNFCVTLVTQLIQ